MSKKLFLSSGKYKLISKPIQENSLNIFYLKNGLKVIHFNTISKAIFISISFKSGLFSETMEKVGISHFLEHIIFNSTLNQTRDQIAETIENLGGEMNGGTSDLSTMYHIKIAKEYFNIACNILSDMVINPAFDEKEMEFERNVIINEIKNDFDNEVDYSQNLMRETYFKNTLYQYTPAGCVESVSKITRDDLKDYYYSNYSAKNGFIIVIGDITQEELNNSLKAFESLREGEKVNKMEVQELNLLNKSLDIENNKKRTQSHFLISYKTTVPNDKDQYSLTVLQNVLDKGLSGRIMKAIRNEEGLAYSISVINDNSSFYGIFYIYVVIEKNNVEKCKKIILTEIDKLFGGKGFDITEEELNNAKTSILGRKSLRDEYIESRHTYLFWSEIFNDFSIFTDFEKKISKVSLSNIETIVKKYFNHYLSVLLY